MDLKKHYEAFTKALAHAYPTENELDMFVQFTFKEPLNNVASPGVHEYRVFQLIGWCEARGWVERLFKSAFERKPDNPRLNALADAIAKDTLDEHETIVKLLKPLLNTSLENPHAGEIRTLLNEQKGPSQLQALVVRFPELNSGEEVLSWKSAMHQAEQRVCAIARHGNHVGTGFLIGPDRIMTNSHVVHEGDPLKFYQVQFGYLEGTDRKTLPTYSLAEELARSDPREYDFAILRLNAVPDGERGYFKARDYLFDKVREPVSLLGHPNGEPLRFSFGVVFDNNSFMGRVAYTANSLPGSSGSPLFRENWNLVAIHHHGEENVNNHGVPMKHILKHLNANDAGHLLETVDSSAK